MYGEHILHSTALIIVLSFGLAVRDAVRKQIEKIRNTFHTKN